jgi:hypothetical protein
VTSHGTASGAHRTTSIPTSKLRILPLFSIIGPAKVRKWRPASCGIALCVCTGHSVVSTDIGISTNRPIPILRRGGDLSMNAQRCIDKPLNEIGGKPLSCEPARLEMARNATVLPLLHLYFFSLNLAIRKPSSPHSAPGLPTCEFLSCA